MPETTLAKALKKFGKNFVVVSGMKADLSESENSVRNRYLEDTLRNLGARPIPVKGRYVAQDGTVTTEESYLARNLPEETKLMLGRLYNQESILDEHGLHLLKENTCIPYAKTGHHVGQSAKLQPAWTELPNGDAVALALKWENKT